MSKVSVAAVASIAFVGVAAVGGRALAEDTSFVVKVEAPSAKKAHKGVAKVHIAPGAGYHVNKDYPTSVSVVAPDGVVVDKPKQTAKDAVKLEEAGADFEVAYTPSDTGKKVFSGELKFAVCSAHSCDPKKAPLSFTVEVK
jgi:hypothetical protein